MQRHPSPNSQLTQTEKDSFDKLPALPPVKEERFDSEGDTETHTAPDGTLFVPVAVGQLAGLYGVGPHVVHCMLCEVCKVSPGVCPQICRVKPRVISPSGFETAGDKANNRKWRNSVRVLMPSGRKGMHLGKWLAVHNLEHMVPEAANSQKRPRPEASSSPDSTPHKAARSPARPSPGKRSRDPAQGSPPTMPRFVLPSSPGSLNSVPALRGEVPTRIPPHLLGLRMPDRVAAALHSLGSAFPAATSTGRPLLPSLGNNAASTRTYQQMQAAAPAPRAPPALHRGPMAAVLTHQLCQLPQLWPHNGNAAALSPRQLAEAVEVVELTPGGSNGESTAHASPVTARSGPSPDSPAAVSAEFAVLSRAEQPDMDLCAQLAFPGEVPSLEQLHWGGLLPAQVSAEEAALIAALLQGTDWELEEASFLYDGQRPLLTAGSLGNFPMGAHMDGPGSLDAHANPTATLRRTGSMLVGSTSFTPAIVANLSAGPPAAEGAVHPGQDEEEEWQQWLL